MSHSRKEFLTQGLFSLGKMLLTSREPKGQADSPHVIRPPGFIPEKAGGCGECTLCEKACPEKVIARPPDITGPVMDFSARGCSVCTLCIAACPTGVLAYPVDEKPLRLGLAWMKTGCLAAGGCFTCSEQCPQGAIRVSWGSEVMVDRESCIGCGRCESCCPVIPGAIRVEPMAAQ